MEAGRVENQRSWGSFIDGCQVNQPTNIPNKTKTEKEEKKEKQEADIKRP